MVELFKHVHEGLPHLELRLRVKGLVILSNPVRVGRRLTDETESYLTTTARAALPLGASPFSIGA